MKALCSCLVVFALLFASCRKLRPASSRLTPKAMGAQIVEVSGGKQIGGVGSKLSDPVVVQVNGADGATVEGALVTFRSPGLMLNPSELLSDSNGQASVSVQLGNIPGDYEVIAETPGPGGKNVAAKLRAIALGYQQKVGKELSEKYCVVCHDPESTPERVSNFDNLAPPRPHLFADGSVYNSLSDADLLKIINDGGAGLGKSPQSPPYRNTLTPAEIKALVAYIRAIADPPYVPYELK